MRLISKNPHREKPDSAIPDHKKWLEKREKEMVRRPSLKRKMIEIIGHAQVNLKASPGSLTGQDTFYLRDKLF